MKNLNGLKIAVAQMNVVPGRPDENAACIVQTAREAAKNDADVVVFPEMCLPGYFIGDMYEDDAFVRDVRHWNQFVVREMAKFDVVVIFGTLVVYEGFKGEDGRLRKSNGALMCHKGEILSNGTLAGTTKTLQPDYRMFDDTRHFFSTRQIAESDTVEVKSLLQPYKVEVKGRAVNLGVMLCEDMWCADYAINPGKELVANGAELLINLSCSPWSWQKNRKRHQVVGDLLKEVGVPFVYANNTGIQNNGKNVIVFDGASTIYGPDGTVVLAAEAYREGLFYQTFSSEMPVVDFGEPDDTVELFAALECAARFIRSLPPHMRKVCVGVSGGIDSSVALAFWAHVLGSENVHAISMPYEGFSGEESQQAGRELCEKLGITLHVKPIKEIVDRIVAQVGDVKVGSLTHKNIQARARMEILAATAQHIGAVFTANWNKVEAAFGFGTLDGDMRGFFAIFGDLTKREVYQVGDYLNREVYGREVIPRHCFEVAPTDELSLDTSPDPFHYGNLERRGYHDEMVRAFVTFRKNPEWFLEMYLENRLEDELKLEEGTLATLFPTPLAFLRDLESHWQKFVGSYFKRVQSVPLALVSKRAFGYDLRESMVTPHFTQRFQELKRQVLAEKGEKKRVVVMGGSFNPPGVHHRQIAESLAEVFDEVVVVPCGLRPDKASVASTTVEDRGNMVKMGFEGLDRVSVDLFDLHGEEFLPLAKMDERFKEHYPDAEIWHFVGPDNVEGGFFQESKIQMEWYQGHEIWDTLNFVVGRISEMKPASTDLPPSSFPLSLNSVSPCRSTIIRKAAAQGLPVEGMVVEGVDAYIREHGLYQNS